MRLFQFLRNHNQQIEPTNNAYSTNSVITIIIIIIIISSFQEWAYAMVRRPSSVCPSVNFCTNSFFSYTNGRIATKLAHDGLQVSVHPGCAQGQGQGQRSCDTGTFVLGRKSLLLPGKWSDRHQTCTRWSPGKPASRVCLRSRSRSKVTWYAHFLGFLKWATPSLTVWLLLLL